MQLDQTNATAYLTASRTFLDQYLTYNVPHTPWVRALQAACRAAGKPAYACWLGALAGGCTVPLRSLQLSSAHLLSARLASAQCCDTCRFEDCMWSMCLSATEHEAGCPVCNSKSKAAPSQLMQGIPRAPDPASCWTMHKAVCWVQGFAYPWQWGGMRPAMSQAFLALVHAHYLTEPGLSQNATYAAQLFSYAQYQVSCQLAERARGS